MKKVKITVLKTTLDEELAAEYGAEGLGPCPMLREGQVFYADYAKPDGLCDEAWKAIYQYVFALAHGAGEGLLQRWAPPRDLQAGDHRGGSIRQLHTRAVKLFTFRISQVFSLYRERGLPCCCPRTPTFF